MLLEDTGLKVAPLTSRPHASFRAVTMNVSTVGNITAPELKIYVYRLGEHAFCVGIQ